MNIGDSIKTPSVFTPALRAEIDQAAQNMGTYQDIVDVGSAVIASRPDKQDGLHKFEVEGGTAECRQESHRPLLTPWKKVTEVHLERMDVQSGGVRFYQVSGDKGYEWDELAEIRRTDSPQSDGFLIQDGLVRFGKTGPQEPARAELVSIKGLVGGKSPVEYRHDITQVTDGKFTWDSKETYSIEFSSQNSTASAGQQAAREQSDRLNNTLTALKDSLKAAVPEVPPGVRYVDKRFPHDVEVEVPGLGLVTGRLELNYQGEVAKFQVSNQNTEYSYEGPSWNSTPGNWYATVTDKSSGFSQELSVQSGGQIRYAESTNTEGKKRQTGDSYMRSSDSDWDSGFGSGGSGF